VVSGVITIQESRVTRPPLLKFKYRGFTLNLSELFEVRRKARMYVVAVIIIISSVSLYGEWLSNERIDVCWFQRLAT